MNEKKIILCVDEEALRRPESIGLEGENILSQTWLETYTEAQEARMMLRLREDLQEVWVVSTDTVDAINLAAALKKDRGDVPVMLVSSNGTGSLRSRAKAAKLDAVLSDCELLQRYRYFKERGIQELLQESKVGGALSGVPGRALSGVTGGVLSGVSPRTLPEMFPSTTTTPTVSSQRVGRPAQIIPVVSASGGTGKSTVAVLAACLAQARGLNTLLVDADLQFGDAHYLMGVQEYLGLDEVVARPDAFARALRSKEPGGLPSLLAAPVRLEQSEKVQAEIPGMVDRLASQFDIIILNTGAFWTEQHLALLERASTVLFLLDQRPSSLRDCKHVLSFCSRCALATQAFRFVLNRCARNALFTSIDASCGLDGHSVAELQEGGREVSELLGAGQPLDLATSKNAFAMSLDCLLDEILPGTTDAMSIKAGSRVSRKAKRGFFLKRRDVACL